MWSWRRCIVDYCGVLLKCPGVVPTSCLNLLVELALVAETGLQGDLNDWSAFGQQVPCLPNAVLGQVGVGCQTDHPL